MNMQPIYDITIIANDISQHGTAENQSFDLDIDSALKYYELLKSSEYPKCSPEFIIHEYKDSVHEAVEYTFSKLHGDKLIRQLPKKIKKQLGLEKLSYLRKDSPNSYYS